jgi:hypothetical protein
LRDVNRSWQLVASESSTLREFITQVVLGNKQVEGHMTRLRNLALGGLAALAMTGVASSAYAIESGAFQYLAGASIGIPAGAAPPAGLYTALETFEGLYGGMNGNFGGTGPGGPKGVQLGSFGAVVPLVWSTGWSFLGASYSAAIIQPFVTAYVGNSTDNSPCSAGVIGGVPGTSGGCAWQQIVINTVWQPINLSWNLGGGWFVSAAFSFQGPDGTQNEVGNANPDFWTFQPGAALSYLSANWNISGNFSYNIYTASAGHATNLGGSAFGNGYTSGNQVVGDLHALYKFGKWEFGPVGYFVAQTTDDVAGGGGCAVLAASVAAGAGCAYQSFVGVGGLVGYDFGPVDLNVWATDTVWSQNTGENGWTIWTRFGFRLWAPDAPKPLVAKN